MLRNNYLSRNKSQPAFRGSGGRAATAEKTGGRGPAREEFVSIGSYKFKEADFLGKGFSSRVYKAVHLQHENEKYAIKVINLRKFKSSSLAMLESEIEVNRKLSHPNIVKFYDAYKTDTFYYIVTEYCPHGDLLHYLSQKKRLDEEQAVSIIRQIVEGYKYLIKKNVLHRDLKPANIMRVGDTWKIGDFGFSVNCSQEYLYDKVNVGTPLYMPPEALKLNKYSHKSDIFAIGIILYEMLAGSTPWPCKTEKELVSKMLSVPLPKPQGLKNEEIFKFFYKSCSIDENNRLSTSEFSAHFAQESNPEESKPHKHSPFSPKQNKALMNKILLDYLVPQKSGSRKQETQGQQSQHKKQESLSTEISQISHKKKQTLMSNNSRYLVSEMQICRLIHYMILNIEHLHIGEQKDKTFITLTLLKYLLRCIKQLENPRKYMQAGLHDWDIYKTTQEYRGIQHQIQNYAKKYEKQYLDFLKSASISVIRAVNRKFPQLSYTSFFTTRFSQYIKSFFLELLRTCNHETMQLCKKSQQPNLNAAFQSVQSLFIFYKILCHKEKPESARNSKMKEIVYIRVVLDYAQSKATFDNFSSTRKKIKLLC